jgi:hypothetical protein
MRARFHGMTGPERQAGSRSRVSTDPKGGRTVGEAVSSMIIKSGTLPYA